MHQFERFVVGDRVEVKSFGINWTDTAYGTVINLTPETPRHSGSVQVTLDTTIRDPVTALPTQLAWFWRGHVRHLTLIEEIADVYV